MYNGEYRKQTRKRQFFPTVVLHVTIFSTGGKFRSVSNFAELHTLTLAACSYALLFLDTWEGIFNIPSGLKGTYSCYYADVT